MEVDIIIGVAIAAVAAFLIAQVSRVSRAVMVHRTLRKGIEHGQPLTADMVDRLDRAPQPGVADQRGGFVLIAIALALICAGLLNPGDNNWLQLLTAALFPLFVGVALLLRLKYGARRAEP